MSRIRNSVYGLALGDAIAYQTEFKDFDDAVSFYRFYGLSKKEHLIVSDDTQMSLALIAGIEDTLLAAYSGTETINKWIRQDIQSYMKYSKNLIPNVGKRYIEWAESPENCRAPGMACMSSLMSLSDKNSKIERQIVSRVYSRLTQRDIDWGEFGRELNAHSKGSGTVMRAPWLGLAAPLFPNESTLREFNIKEAQITHGHPTAIFGSLLTTKISSESLKGNIEIGDFRNYALSYIDSEYNKSFDSGWLELKQHVELSLSNVPESYKNSSAIEIDPSQFVGSSGTAENVLVTALILIDSFGNNPIEVLKRCMVSSGDSDTIGAVAGGLLGTVHKESIWDEHVHLVEPAYIDRLEHTIEFLEKTNEIS